MKQTPRRKNKRKATVGYRPNSLNLYKFIKLVLGEDISDRSIARRWNIDEKNFHEFKTGVYPVPRLDKLEELASVLGVNKHLVFQVAGGSPAQKVFKLIKNNDLAGQTRLLSNQLDKTHRALAQSEKCYRSLVENTPDIVILTDRHGKLNFINRTVEGFTPQDVIGKNIYDYILPQSHSDMKSAIAKVFRTGRNQTLELRGYGAGKSVAWYETNIGAVKHDGKVVAAIQSSRDITQRKKEGTTRRKD